jgi:CRP-like cAMP-binding protein
MQQQPMLEILAHSPWFSSLPETLAAELVSLCKLKTLADQQVLHKKNDLADGFVCVLSGRIRISNYTLQGKELILTWMQPGNWFGEISLLDGQPRTHDAHTEGKTVILKLSAGAFHTMLRNNNQWYAHFSRLLCQRVRASFSQIDETGCLSLTGQLCKRLLLLQQGLESEHCVNSQNKLRISQDALAQLIHSSRQTVNKILQDLRVKGLIDLKYRKIQLLDRDKLAELSRI